MKISTSYRAFIPAFLIVVTFLFSTVSVASDMNKGDTLTLDLKTVMKAALEYNHALKVSRLTPLTAKESIHVAASLFDPQVSVTGNTSDQESWDESNGSSTLQLSSEASVSKKMETGTSYSISLTAGETDSETDWDGDIGGSYLQTTASKYPSIYSSK